MAAADYAALRGEFIAAYNADGIKVLDRTFKSGNCCFAVKGGKKLTIQKATLRDEQRGTITASFFNQPWLPGKHAEGSRVAISGTVEKWRTELRIKAPKMTSLDDDVVAQEPGRTGNECALVLGHRSKIF